jgi:hypothetical protein
MLQFAAHLLADFTFQPQKWCDKKGSLLSFGIAFLLGIIYLAKFAYII